MAEEKLKVHVSGLKTHIAWIFFSPWYRFNRAPNKIKSCDYKQRQNYKTRSFRFL